LNELPQNHQLLEVQITVRYVGMTRVPTTRSIGARQRREGESARNPEAPIPLPAADQLVHDTDGAASEALPVPKRQLITGVRVELVVEAVGCDPAVQFPPVIRTGDIRWLVTSRRSKDSGI